MSVDMDRRVHIRDVGDRTERFRGSAGHHGSGGGRYVECCAAQTASAVRVNLGGRSADVPHRQSVTAEVVGDKLGGVAGITQRPLERV